MRVPKREKLEGEGDSSSSTRPRKRARAAPATVQSTGAGAGAGAGSGAGAGHGMVNRVDGTRVRVLSDVPSSAGPTSPVVYWMSRDQRVSDNWALLHAQDHALHARAPLVVVFSLVSGFLGATERQFGFMLKGLAQLELSLRAHGIPFVLLRGSPSDTVPAFVARHDVGVLVTDYSPLRLGREWREAVAGSVACRVEEVDAHNIVPVWVASDHIEYAARTIRPKINNRLHEYLTEFPPLVSPHPIEWSPTPAVGGASEDGAASRVKKTKDGLVDWAAVRAAMKLDQSVPEVDWLKTGERAAKVGLAAFLKPARFKRYAKLRNDPVANATSGLSPWFHFGHLAPQRAAWEVTVGKRERGLDGDAAAGFLEEMIVRRELTDNYCHYNREGYDKLDGLYPQYDNNSWAQKSLRLHARDKREYVYTREQFEKAHTHDDLWNAAQSELVTHGRMHGFMRMYWAKKILEWSPSPSEALDTAIWLNDRYQLDGRDPNGYVGCAWAIGGVHDQGWREREVFGKIRFMNYKGCKRKFDVAAYVEKYPVPDVE